MTLLPSESWNIAGVEGDRYTVGPYCDAPGCKRPVDHKHHLWRRSFLGGDFWWVRVPVEASETTVIRNVVGLCWHHHDDVTGQGGGHKAWIRWTPERQELAWMEAVDYGHWIQIGTLSLPAPSDHAAPATPGREAERCPTCGKLKRKHEDHEHEPQPRRPRRTWTIKVPDDKENGAEVLNELVEACAEIFGHDEYRSATRRYYTVAQALALVLQNRHLIELEIDAA